MFPLKTHLTHGARRAVLAISLFAASSMPFAALANPRIVVDVTTLKVLDQEQPFRKWYPASLTKLMTAYTTFRAIKAGEVRLDSVVTMSARAAAQPASKMYYRPGQQLTLDSALKILLVKSANDVAVAVAEAVAGSQENFVLRMNAEAARIGMTDSHFINPNGLPGKGQYTTARDLALLAVYLKREFPEFAGYFNIEGIDTGKRKYPNFNMLIGRFDGADGMKTGFICASGFNQVSSATRNGRSVVSVVLGTDSLAARADMSADLLQRAFVSPSAIGPRLDRLMPDADEGLEVADITAEICSSKGAKVRSESRDEAGRQKLVSPYVHEMDREPVYVFAGLIPGLEVNQPQKKAATKKTGGKKTAPKKEKGKTFAVKAAKPEIDEGDAAPVPVPVPKPKG